MAGYGLVQRLKELRDAHTYLVVFTISYFLLILVLGAAELYRGEITVLEFLTANNLVIINIIMGLLYLSYLAFYRGKVYLRYENTDKHRFLFVAAIGALLHVFLSVIQVYFFSVNPLAYALYRFLLGSALTMVAITENAFFIGVIGDYFAERYNKIVGAVATGLAAMLYHVGVYGHSGTALLIVFIYFAYWAWASFYSGSTLYADLHHMIGNYIGFIYSVARVIP